MKLLFLLEISVKSRHKSKSSTYAKQLFNYEPERMFKYIARLPPFQNKTSELSWLCSGNMPGWGTDAIEFWKAVEEHERENGMLYRQILFALPIVLSKNQKMALTEKFVEAVIGDRVHPYTYAIHEINGGNPHCHLILSERMNDGCDRTPETWFGNAILRPEDKSAVRPLKPPQEGGGARKANLFRKYGGATNYYLMMRELWETTANKALEEARCPERIDRRSFKEQNIRRITQIRLHPRDEAIEKSLMEKLGITPQKSKLKKWITEANNIIKLIEKIMENSYHEYGMDIFELGETKTWIRKKIKNPENKDVKKTIKDFFREIEIEKRAKKNITDMRYKINEIKKIKKTIEDDDKEWDKENKELGFMKKKIKEFGSVINDWENDMREFDEEQKEWIEYLEKEIADYFLIIYYEEQLEAHLPKTDYSEGLQDFLSRLDYDKEPEDYIPAIYAEYKGKNGIIQLSKRNPNSQYMERMELARYYEHLKQDEVNHPFTFREATQAEIKSFLAKAEQSDTTKETEQKENQKISPIPKLVHNNDKIRIEKYLKNDTPFLGRIRIGDRYMLDGHLVDTKDYSIDHRGIVKTKYGVEIPLQKMDKQPETKRVVIYEEDDPKMPKVVSADDYFMIKKYLEDETPFLVIIKISSYRYSLDGRFVDIENYSIDYKGIVKTKDGAEIPPESLRLLRLNRKQFEEISQKTINMKFVTPKTDDKILPPENIFSVQLNGEKRKKTLTEALDDARRRDKLKRDRALKKIKDFGGKAKPIDAVNKDDKEGRNKLKESGKPFLTTTLNKDNKWEIVEGFNGAEKDIDKYEIIKRGNKAILKDYDRTITKDGKSSNVETADEAATKRAIFGVRQTSKPSIKLKDIKLIDINDKEITIEKYLNSNNKEPILLYIKGKLHGLNGVKSKDFTVGLDKIVKAKKDGTELKFYKESDRKIDDVKNNEIETPDIPTTGQTVSGGQQPKEEIPNQQDLTQQSDTPTVDTSGANENEGKDGDGQTIKKGSDIPQPTPSVEESKTPEFNFDDLRVVDTTKSVDVLEKYMAIKYAEMQPDEPMPDEFKKPRLWIVKDPYSDELYLGGTGGVKPKPFTLSSGKVELKEDGTEIKPLEELEQEIGGGGSDAQQTVSGVEEPATGSAGTSNANENEGKDGDGQTIKKGSDIPQPTPSVEESKTPEFNFDDLRVVDTTKSVDVLEKYMAIKYAEMQPDEPMPDEFKKPRLWIVKDPYSDELYLGGTGGVKPKPFTLSSGKVELKEDGTEIKPLEELEQEISDQNGDTLSVNTSNKSDKNISETPADKQRKRIDERKAERSRINPEELFESKMSKEELEAKEQEYNDKDILYVVMKSPQDREVIRHNLEKAFNDKEIKEKIKKIQAGKSSGIGIGD